MMRIVLSRFLRIVYLFVLFTFLHTTFINAAYAQRQAAKRTSHGVWYLEHLPKNYRSSREKFPVIIFLHGAGEKGNGAGGLNKLKKWGPPKHAERGDDMTFRVNGKNYSFIVISPQLPTNKGNWQPSMIDDVINYTLRNYKVDPDRVYLTGLSLGGGGTWYYATSSYNKPNKLAAIAPVCGFLSSSKDVKSLADNNVAVWGFHNSRDNVVSMSRGKAPIDKLKRYHPKSTPKFTVYNAKGHNAWTKAYTTNNSVHSPNLYQWFLSHRRGKSSGNDAPVAKNQAPIANAGSNESLKLPKNYVTLNGNRSSDKDGSISKYYWKKVSGPSAHIDKSTSASTRVRSLREGKYVFELAVTDNKGATDKDQVTVLVSRKDQPKPAEEKPSKPAVADKGVSGKHGLRYKYYEGDIRKVSDLNRQRVRKQGTIANFNISPKRRQYYFGFEYEGYIEIKKTGTYTFYTTSDDGSALWIGSKKVVNNDGIHYKKQRSGKLYLKAGMHAIKVAFFEHANGEMLQVAYAGPGISKREIPNSVLYLDGNGQNAPVASATPNHAAPSSASGKHGLHYKYYEGNRMREVADVSASKSTLKKQGTIANFDISAHQRPYYFGFEYEGYIEIKKTGTYTFYTTSDAGSALWIGSKKVVNNDGIHTKRQRSGSVYLKAGMHAIKVVFFEHANGEMLQVAYAGPGISKREIPNSVLFLSNSNARIAGSSKSKGEAETATTTELGEQLEHIEVRAYPNPVIDVVHVELGGEQGEVATLSVIDQLGRVVYSQAKTMSGYAQTVELNLSALGLKPGMTFLQVDAPSYGKKTIKLLKK